MTTYFSVLPKELIELLLYKVDQRTLIDIILSKNYEFQMLNSLLFWTNYVKLNFPEATFKYLPKYLYEWQDFDNVSTVLNYERYDNDYERTMEILNYDELWTDPNYDNTEPHYFDINSITNYQLISDILRPHFDDISDLKVFLATRAWAAYHKSMKSFLVIGLGDHGNKLFIGNLTLSITKRQTADLLLHIYSNNYDEEYI